MQFMTTSQNAFILDANVTGIRTQRKINKILFESKKTKRTSKHNKKLIVDDEEITNQTHILECIREFCNTLFKKRKQKTAAETESFLSRINVANWRSISVLNVDLKIISKALSEKLNKVVPNLISSQKKHVQNRLG